MQEQAHLIGLEAVTDVAIRFQGQLVSLLSFSMWPRAQEDVPVEHLGAGLLLSVTTKRVLTPCADTSTLMTTRRERDHVPAWERVE